MIAYFHLAPPESERLLAEGMKGSPAPQIETHTCAVGTKTHCDLYRRVSDLELQVRHDDRGQLMIWAWISGCLVHESLLAEFRKANLTGYRTRQAALRFRDGAVTTEYRELVVTG